MSEIEPISPEINERPSAEVATGRRTGQTLLVASVGIVLALVPALLLFDFTVDDALIPARYATHIARGQGYRWNTSGAVTDGVTPLGFPYLLAPFASAGPLAALAWAKLLGLFGWTASAALFAVAIDRSSRSRLRFVGLAMLAVSAPLAAWSVAGLETGLAAAFASAAVSLLSLDKRVLGVCFSGLAAALRPELLPFVLIFAMTPPPGKPAQLGLKETGFVALGALPFVLVVATRLALFGRPTPLSVLAKPSDPVLGAKYALACFLLTGPLVLLAPLAIAKANAFVKMLVLAVLVHFTAIAVAGGDWMPLSRLVVPVLPAVMMIAAHLAAIADRRATLVRSALAMAGELFVTVSIGPKAARVGPDRLAIAREIAPHLEGARVVAALDIGWVGAATEATIVDLAGLTDPSIAVLPGGHTTKRIPPSFIDSRGVDALVLMLGPSETIASPWPRSVFARGVEAWIASFPGMDESFVVTAESHVPGLPYVVLRRRSSKVSEGP